MVESGEQLHMQMAHDETSKKAYKWFKEEPYQIKYMKNKNKRHENLKK